MAKLVTFQQVQNSFHKTCELRDQFKEGLIESITLSMKLEYQKDNRCFRYALETPVSVEGLWCEYVCYDAKNDRFSLIDHEGAYSGEEINGINLTEVIDTSALTSIFYEFLFDAGNYYDEDGNEIE